MQSPLFSFFLLIALLGCQGASNLASVGGGNNASEVGGNSNSLGSGNDLSGNGVDKLNPDPGITQYTPQTISSSPVMGSTTGSACLGPQLLCLKKIYLSDPEKCPGDSIYIVGNLISTAPDTVFEKVEVNIQFPGGNITTQGFFLSHDPVSGMSIGKFHTFADAKPGNLVKFSARRTDHSEEAPVIAEIELDPLLPSPEYQGTCNPALLNVVPDAVTVSDPGSL